MSTTVLQDQPRPPDAMVYPAIPAAAAFKSDIAAVATHGDRDAFIRLFEYFAPRVKSFLMRGGFRADLADELAQETMLSVWEHAGTFDPARSQPSTWIFTIARNKRIDYLRKVNRTPVDPLDPMLAPSEPPPPDAALQATESRAALSSVIAALPPEQSALIRKAYFEGKTHQAIAAEAKLPLGTVKSRIRLALERMRTGLQDLAA